MNSRRATNELIISIEKSINITYVKYNNYYIWPVLRICLYMYLNKKKSYKALNEHKKIKHFSLCKYMHELFYRKKKTKYLFVGAPTHCISLNGKTYNRYFDPLMDQEDYNDSLYLSKANTKRKAYKSNRHLSFTLPLLVYKVYDRIFNYSREVPDVIAQLVKLLNDRGVDTTGFENEAIRFIRSVDVSFSSSLNILKKLEPKEVWVLCYYSEDILGLLIAAHKLSIPSFDMQHGGQGKYHLAYNSWSNLPAHGYEALPDIFYTWDEKSAEEINKWAANTEKHSAEKFGNPWVAYWKGNDFGNKHYVWPENIILYTLQPIDDPLEPYILETIKNTKDQWCWWLRVHPRQLHEIKNFKSRLEDENLLESVNIDDATNLPLPEILKHSKLHITKFSGCALEAYEFKTPTIIIDKRGVDIYKEYIDMSDFMYSSLSKNSSSVINDINYKGNIYKEIN